MKKRVWSSWKQIISESFDLELTHTESLSHFVTSQLIDPNHVIGVFSWKQLIHQFKCVKIQHVLQFKFSACFQFIFWEIFQLSAVRSWLRSTDGVSHRSILTAALRPASKFALSALDPCSDSLLLGVCR